MVVIRFLAVVACVGLLLGAGCGDDDSTGAQCGDGTLNGSELCDGADLGTEDCTTQGLGFTGGTLACNATCDSFDVSGCTSGADVCGDNAATGSELCDGSDLGTDDCTTVAGGYTGGTLACNGSCDGWDTTGCTTTGVVCGDGTNDAAEKCDDSNTVNGDGCNPTCSMTGTVATTAGTAGVSGVSDGTGAAAEFTSPSGIATDGSSLFVSDTANCTVRQVDLSTWAVTTLAGNAGTCGHADGVGTAAQFDIAQDLAYHGGYVYVADTDNHCIRQIEVGTGTVTTVAGVADTAGTADGVGAAAGFTEPRGITTDGVNLYVADFGAHTVRQIVIATWAVTTLAGQAGTAGGADGTGTAATFNYPRSITEHGGYLYIADTNNHTVRQLDLGSGAVITVAGTAGNAGAADGVGAAASFTSPRGIAADANSLYVADHGNNAIRQIQMGTWDVTTLCGNTANAGSADGVGTAATMDGPWGLLFDPGLVTPGQRLYVAESGNNILRTID